MQKLMQKMAKGRGIQSVLARQGIGVDKHNPLFRDGQQWLDRLIHD